VHTGTFVLTGHNNNKKKKKKKKRRIRRRLLLAGMVKQGTVFPAHARNAYRRMQV
jgi:hypothetical protein